jgi:hypothetical protein
MWRGERGRGAELKGEEGGKEVNIITSPVSVKGSASILILFAPLSSSLDFRCEMVLYMSHPCYTRCVHMLFDFFSFQQSARGLINSALMHSPRGLINSALLHSPRAVIKSALIFI